MTFITFLNEREDSINRKAIVSPCGIEDYHISNLNMPFCGTINEIWSREEMDAAIDNHEVKIDVDESQ